MALPALIEIEPLRAPVAADIVVPGSKSLTNRALILAALAQGTVTLRGALWSEDTQVMLEALQCLGFRVTVSMDLQESGNRTLTVVGGGGALPHGGTAATPLDLAVGNAGTAARFLAALVCLGQGVYRLDGVPRMRDRPQASLFAALRQLGYRIDSPNDRLPAVIHGHGPRRAACEVAIGESSQFASALLLAAAAGQWQVRVTGEDAEESPYVSMTLRLLEQFPHHGGTFQIEPDASGGSYFCAASFLQRLRFPSAPNIRVCHWPETDWQVDARFPGYLPLPSQLSRRADLGDSIMTAIALAPLSSRPVRFTDLGRLRVQECERVVALRTELTRCGARVEEQGDTLTVHPSTLHGAVIETYDDHRMAMCFATLGLHVPGLKINNPACVRKTFPTFFQKLASPPPHGLGATILDASTGDPLDLDRLDAS